LIELEVRLTDVALDMMDKLVGNAFTRGKNTKERAYVATTKDVGRLMRLFDRMIEALSQAQGADRDAFAVVDETVGWAQLLRARPEIASLAALTEEDPLVRAADRYATIRKFAPALLEVLEFKAAKATVAPSAMLRKLAAYERQNQLDLALQELGRIERTLFMLDWLESPELRRRCQAGLNKGEQHHALAQAICTFKQGRIADRGTEAQQYKASGLNLLIAAIVYWNSTYMADAVVHLRATGE